MDKTKQRKVALILSITFNDRAMTEFENWAKEESVMFNLLQILRSSINILIEKFYKYIDYIQYVNTSLPSLCEIFY